MNLLKSMRTHFDLVKCAQTMIPGWNHVMKHAVKECHEPAEKNQTKPLLWDTQSKTLQTLTEFW